MPIINRHVTAVLFMCAGVFLAQPAMPEDQPAKEEGKPEAILPSEGMTNLRLDQLIHRLDENAQGNPGFWKFSIEKIELTVITDERSDRMRIITPVSNGEELDQAMLYRLMQSNFDSALDARYSIAKGALWSTYIHPLASLEDEEFLSAVGQVVNLSITYGTSFSSGQLIFRGGDSSELQRRKLIDELIEKGMSI